jgi:hypothetical protein
VTERTDVNDIWDTPCHAHDIPLTADLYLCCGGTVRIPLAERPEDIASPNRAREHSDRVVRAENAVVEDNLRRLRAWRPRRTLLRYRDRRDRSTDEAAVHVR